MKTPGANNLAFGDVNNDGHFDLIVTSSQSRRVTILLGQGDGRFVSDSTGPFEVPESPHEVALGDVNGDKNLDLALANHDSYNVVLLIGTGRGTFRLAPSSPIAMKRGRQPHTHGLGGGHRRADWARVAVRPDPVEALRAEEGALARSSLQPRGAPVQLARCPALRSHSARRRWLQGSARATSGRDG